MQKKLFIFLLILVLILQFGYGLGNVRASTEISDVLSLQSFSVDSKVGGISVIKAPGFRVFPSISDNFPVKVLFYALPPGSTVKTVKVTGAIVESENVHSNDKFSPVQDMKFGSEIHKTNCPALFYEQGKIRKWDFVKLYYSPFVWNSKKNTLDIYKSLHFTIIPKTVDKESSVEMADEAFDSLASKLFTNYSTAENWYKKPLLCSGPGERYDYLIIADSSLIPSLSSFVKYKEENDKLRIKVVSLSDVKVHSRGGTTQEKIRNYIKLHYLEWGIKYVLFVGGPKAIPMCYMYPEPNEKRDENGLERPVGRTPTDFYYAELDSNWDADKDQLPGEYSEDTNEIKDYYPDVFVGRIPFDNPDKVRKVLDNSIRFEESKESFRKSALFVGAMLYYGEEGTSRQDGSLALNFAWQNYLKPAGFTGFSMYEQSGTHPSIFKSDVPLTEDNFVKQMRSKKYGLVLWNAHGSPTFIARKYWDDANKDGKVEAGEIKWVTLLSTSDIDKYRFAPSIFYAASCETAWPEKDNIGFETLLHGAAAYIGASRISYGGGTIDPVLEGFVKHYAVDKFGIGDSLDISLFEMPHTAKADFVNLYDFNLYGDPSLSLNPPSFTHSTINLDKGSVTVPQGGNCSVTVSISTDEDSSINLDYSIDVEGLSGSFSENSIATSKDITFSVTCSGDTPEGDFVMRIYGETKDGVQFSVPLHIKVVQHQFSMYDLNKDGKINGKDLIIFSMSFGLHKGEKNFNPNADFNSDGIIDGKDLTLFSMYFGSDD